MKRLTFDGLFCDIAKCDSTPGGTFCETGTCTQRRVWERLKEYEDTGLEPEDLKKAFNETAILKLAAQALSTTPDHLRDLLQAEQDGRLLELPFVAMVEQSLQDGKMKPMGDQKHNGRYAVVYVDHNKWKSPLIDICGKPYNREEAENRMAALAEKGGKDHA